MTHTRYYSELLDQILSAQQNRRGFLRRAIGVGLATPAISTLIAACGDDDDDTTEDEPDGDTSDEGSTEPTATETMADEGEEESSGGGATPAGEETEETEDTEATEDTGEEATEPADSGSSDEPAGEAGGTAVLAVTADPASWDQTKTTWPSWEGVHFLYDRLVGFDAEEQLVPQLAESWEISEDGLEYVLHLREGVTFHDGNPFNAEAVKFNVQRHLDRPDSASYEEFQAVESVEVVDDMTVNITLGSIQFDFQYNIGTWGAAQVSPEAYGDGSTFSENPIGTGPFKFGSYTPGSDIQYVRNEEYWNGPPLLDGVQVRVIPEPSVAIIEMEAGTADVVGVEPKDVGVLEDQGITIEQTITPGAQMVSLNVSQEPTSELAVRQAIAHAIDRDAIIEQVLLGFGEKSRAGVNENSPYYSEDVPMIEYDPELAAQLLDEAGWVMGDGDIRQRDGQPLFLNMLSTDFSNWGLYNQIIQEQLREVGIDSEITTLEWNAMLDQWRENQGEWNISYHSQGSQLASTSIIQASWAPEDFWNICQLDDATVPELESVREELQSIDDELEIALDMEARKELAKQAQTLFQENQLTVWLWHAASLTAINPRLKGYDFSFAGRIIRLDKAAVS